MIEVPQTNKRGLMDKNVINMLIVIFCTFCSPFVCSEIYKCEVDGKLTFQQVPCPIEVVEEECDSTYDYAKNVYIQDSSFDDTYCYYLQLENVEKKEKARLILAYKQKRAEAQRLVKQEEVYDKLNYGAQDAKSYVQKSNEASYQSEGYIE